MIGVKGVGMAALAEVLVKNGFIVSGSDAKDDFITAGALKRLNINITKFSAENVKNAKAVIRSNAYNSDNAEVRAAQYLNIPIFSYPEVVAELFNAHYGIAVAGSHGKTTTTAMLAHILKSAEKNITAIVGSTVLDWGSGAIAGDLAKPDALFVLEADEYKEAFLNYHPRGAIITNIDYDHPDYFKTPKSYVEAFENLAAQIQPGGFLIGCGDDAEVVKILDTAKKALAKGGQAGVKTYSYGFEKTNDFHITEEKIKNSKQCFTVKFAGKKYDFTVPYPGRQYVLNSVAAFAAAKHLGVAPEKIAQGIATFPGTARRLEVLKNENGVMIIDDYAHHPTAITVTLAGIKAMYPGKKIVALFQPHMFSRTEALLHEFASCFTPADIVGIMEIYPSARETSGPVNGKDLADATKQKHTGKDKRSSWLRHNLKG